MSAKITVRQCIELAERGQWLALVEFFRHNEARAAAAGPRSEALTLKFKFELVCSKILGRCFREASTPHLER